MRSRSPSSRAIRASAACTASAASSRRRRGRVKSDAASRSIRLAACLPVRRVRRVDLDRRRGDERGAPLPLPRPAAAEGRQRRHRNRHRPALQGGVVRAGADRLARPGRAEARAHLHSLAGRQPRVGARPLVRRPGRHRQDLARGPGREGGEGRRTLVRDVPRADAARRDQAHLRPRLGRQLPRLLPAAVLGRPARARRPRRREADRVGPRAALLDRQRALAGPPLDRRHHQPARSGPASPPAACSREARATCATP